MNRKEREITDRSRIDEILHAAEICRLGLCNNGVPYIVPLCFGYDGSAIYAHSARSGRKLDIIRVNNLVCFEVEADTRLVMKDIASSCTMKYRSVIGYGRASIIDDPKAMIPAYDILMSHYRRGPFEYSEKLLAESLIIKIEIETISGKLSL